MNKKINIKIVLVLLLLIIIPFYSFLAWKMSRTSNHFVSDPKFIAKSFFTWNPAELFNNIYNKWDSLYLYKKGVKPASDFNSMKNTLEKEVGVEIYFAGLSNGIFFDDNGEVFSNEGDFILKEDDEYNYYSYNIYIDDKKAEKSYESDKRIGLEIFKKPGTVSVENIEKYKNFSNAALTALGQVVDDNFMENAKLLSVSSFGEDFQMIQTADENLKPIKTIEFDYLGNIIPEKKEIDYRAQEANATNVDKKKESQEKIDPFLDSDGDGLLDKDEIIYGTEINNPDTDGDGYSDGDEVKNGFNPNGDGLLVQ